MMQQEYLNVAHHVTLQPSWGTYTFFYIYLLTYLSACHCFRQCAKLEASIIVQVPSYSLHSIATPLFLLLHPLTSTGSTIYHSFFFIWYCNCFNSNTHRILHVKKFKKCKSWHPNSSPALHRVIEQFIKPDFEVLELVLLKFCYLYLKVTVFPWFCDFCKLLAINDVRQ